MAIGRLGSLKTSLTLGLNDNTELYLASGSLSDVTVSVTNQGYETASYFVGISSGSISAIHDSDYIVWNKKIKPNESTSLNVGIKSGDLIFCKASQPDVGFLAFSTFEYSSGISTYYGRENSLKTSEDNNTPNSNIELFRATRNSKTTLVINNKNAEEVFVSAGISSAGLSYFRSGDYLIKAVKLSPRESITISDIGVGDSQSLIVRASKVDVSFTAFSVPSDPDELGFVEQITVDDISSGFNGVTTSFNLTRNGGIATYYPESAYKLIVSLNGVIQEPNESYTITSGTIGFSSAPQSGDEFFAFDISSSSGGGGSINYNDLTNKPTFAPVATTGDYNDLANTPSIPAAQQPADWNATSGATRILNKPTIPLYIANLADVSGTEPSVNQSLKWDGTSWSPSHSGIALQDDGSLVGSASTINFGSNLSVSISNDIATITASTSAGISSALDTRLYSVAEKFARVTGNTVSIVYGNGSTANVGVCVSPTGDISVNVIGIPDDSSFDNSVISFSVFVVQSGTARSCTSVSLNGVSKQIRWFGGSLASAISGVTTNTNGVDIYNFTGINTVGSASTTDNYLVLGSVNGGYV